ncbi:hypothetical protein NA57DRAFT_61229 [Rhizodiscina lignyota]|uniref:F-box domain-containing protein n=1 Tax=Rhizodiscina lignyota TaxID=1504668 RepID=A0A9P4I5U5_9PEZI|nr:hypothetical protein NA57DRAFT_61229 [Rhizodiscina lignyota]
MSNSRSLLDLSNELLLDIVESLRDDTHALLSLAQSCSRMQKIAEPLIYNQIYIQSGTRLEQVVHAFTSRPARADAVDSLRLKIRHHEYRSTSAITTWVKQIPNLRSWSIESPWCGETPDVQSSWHTTPHWVEEESDKWQEDITNFEKAFQEAAISNPQRNPEALPALRSFTLHSHGLREKHWNIRDMAAIFFHQTLEYIHLSRVSGTEKDTKRLTIASNFPKSTPLKNLVLEDCKIIAAALFPILSLPKALTNFTLQESMAWGVEMAGQTPIEFFAALRQQAQSLQYLKHHASFGDIYTLQNTTQWHGALLEFEALSCLQISPQSALCNCIREGLAPPNLETLRVASTLTIKGRDQARDAAEDEFREISQLPKPDSLRNFDFVPSNWLLDVSEPWAYASLVFDLLPMMQNLMVELRSRNIAFRTFVDQLLRGGNISRMEDYKEVLVFDESMFESTESRANLTMKDKEGFQSQLLKKLDATMNERESMRPQSNL